METWGSNAVHFFKGKMGIGSDFFLSATTGRRWRADAELCCVNLLVSVTSEKGFLRNASILRGSGH